MSVNSSSAGYSAQNNLPARNDAAPTMDRGAASSALARLRAVVADRIDIQQPAVQQQNTPAQLSPQELAMLAEKRRRELEGGGGGGGARFKSPTQFVLYSFRLINDKLMQLYQSVSAALNENLMNANAAGREAMATTMTSVYNAIPKNMQGLMMNVMRGLDTMQNQAQNFLKSAANLAQQLSSSFVNLATVSMSALANRFVRLLGFGRDDDEKFEAEEVADKYIPSEEELETSIDAALFSDQQDNEKNGRNIIAHLENFSRWLTGRR